MVILPDIAQEATWEAAYFNSITFVVLTNGKPPYNLYIAPPEKDREQLCVRDNMGEHSKSSGSGKRNIVNYGAQHGVCVTGDHNVVYQIITPDRSQLEGLLAGIDAGQQKGASRGSFAGPTLKN